jgi:hypothetical protein
MHDFNRAKKGFVTGHDFSRAEKESLTNLGL